MKVAVIGSRTYKNQVFATKALDLIHKELNITELISGGAIGPDKLSELWAKKNRISTRIIYPDWEHLGKSAGFQRNHQIVAAAQIVVAFWDGNSKGTAHSINLARSKGIDVLVFNEAGELQ